MVEPQYGCDESNIPDNESDISERCFTNSYRGQSRKWLIRDGYPKRGDGVIKSTMKETYPYPFQEDRNNLGERRTMILKQLFEEAAHEIINEREVPPPVEKYCTEYDGNFNSNVKISSEENEEEIKKRNEKYPLYSSNAMSFWNFKLEKYDKSNVYFPGLTTSADLKNPFKRYSTFTKPISEVLDESNL